MFDPRGPTFWELARQALSSTERGYDLLAPKFDYTPFRTPDEVLDGVASFLERRGPFAKGLDLCCGTGAAMQMLGPLCRDLVVGLDFSRGMLTVCRQNMRVAPGPARLGYVRGNALRLPFAGAFDLIVCLGALGHIDDANQDAFLREIHRALGPSGLYVFVSSYPPSMLSARYWAARAFNGVMRVRNVLHAPPFIMYYLRFLLPEVEQALARVGMGVEVYPLARGGFWADFRIVVARKIGAQLADSSVGLVLS